MRTAFIFSLALSLALLAGPKEHDLFQAIESNNLNRVKEMVAAGADLSSLNQKDETPLMAAIRKDYEEIVFFLVKSGSEYPPCEYNEHVIKRKLMAREDMCRGNMRKILEAIELYQLEVFWKDRIKKMCLVEKIKSKLMPYMYDEKFPQCPEGGQYVYDPRTDAMFCTVHGELKRFEEK